jgi:hypothetical protein
MSGIFQLQTPSDLREKLRRDFDKLKAEPLNADAAFNFFVTAEHMPDWAFPGEAGKDDRKEARRGSALMRVCSHLANGAKHFEVDDQRHDLVSSTETVEHTISVVRIASITGPFVSRPKLLLTLKGKAAAELGKVIGALELAQQVMDYWDKQQLK